jgi:hypothetical protein
VREITLENLGWQVVSLLSAEWTLCGNPRIRHGAYRGWDVLTAFLAADREVAIPSLRKVEHECQYRRTKGETAMWITSELNTGKIVEMCREGVGSLISMVYGEAC